MNSTWLKDQLLSHLPELEAYHEGRDVLLAFHSEIGTWCKQVKHVTPLTCRNLLQSYVRRYSLTNGRSNRHWRGGG